VVFAADDRVHGVEPWISDGTPEGTVLLADVAPGPASSSPEGFTPVRNRIYFSADDGTHARELHVVEPPCPENAHCLQGGRYHVRVRWRDFEDRQGSGHPVPATDDSGIFWFFAPTNWEMLVKVLEGCNFNDHRWVFFAATTNVEYTVRVTDSWTGEIREYPNPLGHSAETVIDLDAFPCGDPWPLNAGRAALRR
jgi:ELWxxDGT repeat protein